MKRRGRLIVAVGSIVCLLAPLARASPVTFEFAGEVTRVFDPDNLLQGAVVIGSPFSGSYTFESTTPDSDPHARRGAYESSVSALVGEIAYLPFELRAGTPSRIEIRNGFSAPSLDYYTLSAEVVFDGRTLDLFLLLGDTTGTVFSNDLLPVTPPDLGLFASREFDIFDGSEQLRLHIDGTLSSLVPAPPTLTMLVIGLCLVWRQRGQRHRRTVASTNTRDRSCSAWLLVAVLMGASVDGRVTAQDCNDNGILDAQELGAPCKVDVVFLLDTSGSIGGQMTFLCDAMNNAIGVLSAELTPQNVHVEKLAITSGEQTVDCTCCNGSAPALYGTPPLPGLPTLGSCTNPEDAGNEEDWALATAFVAVNKTWTPGAIRIIVPISDEGPRCGNPIEYPSSDGEIVRQTGCVISGRGVIVAPIIGAYEGIDIEQMRFFARQLGDAGAKFPRVFDLNQADLAQAIFLFVRGNCPSDCNFNGEIDACDINLDGIVDCNAFESDCCSAHMQPGCEEPSVASCVCVGFGLQNCCDTEWVGACADVAPACGASCPRLPDGIPDECQGSPDCDLDGTPDACEISCGDLFFGPCHVAGCGEETDCNQNCVPDDCDISQCESGDADCDDCNGNSFPDACDIGDGTSCDLNEDGVPDECFACCEQGSCSNESAGCSGAWYNSEKFTCADCLCGDVACCLGNACEVLSGCACEALGRTVPQRTTVPIDCASNACNIGACCLPSGGCDDRAASNPPCNPEIPSTCMGQTRCVDTLGGVFLGGLLCTPDPCAALPPDPRPDSPLPEPQQCPQPQPTPACQTSSGDCACRNAQSCIDGICRCTIDADCRGQAKCVNEVCYVPKNRYLSFLPQNSGLRTALRVTFVSLPAHADDSRNYSVFNGAQMWVGSPAEVCEVSGIPGLCPECTDPTLLAAPLVCNPYYDNWDTTRVLNVYHHAIVPGGTYAIEAVADRCPFNVGASFSLPLTLRTADFGDIVGPVALVEPAPSGDKWSPPDGSATVHMDATAGLDKFANRHGPPGKVRADNHPEKPDQNVSIADVVYVLDGFRKKGYPFARPTQLCE